MKKWIFGAVIVAILAVGVIIRIPKDYEPRRPEVELVVQDHSYEETAPAEQLGPEFDPFPSEGWTWVDRPKWPDWVKFYRKKVLFTRTAVAIDFARYDDLTRTGEGDSVQTSPYNIPVLIGDAKGLALVRLISYYEGPSSASAIFYDPYGNVIGECDNLLGDLPTFDPTGRYFFVEYCDGEGGEIGPVRFFRCDGTKLFDLNEEDVDRDLHRVIPSFKGTGHLSMFAESGFVGFSEKRPEIFGVVVITVAPDRIWNGSIGSDKGPTFMLVYDIKRTLLGAVRLRYFKSA